jgi:hydroxypyruvate isomerase
LGGARGNEPELWPEGYREPMEGEKGCMDRREFAKAIVGAAAGSALVGGAPSLSQGGLNSPLIEFSVMLWTVYGEMPFEEKLERVADAGYEAVELVLEFEKWTDEEIRRVNGKKRRLGMHFDTMAGMKIAAADPRRRTENLEEMKRLLVIAEKLESPSIIVLSGNRMENVGRETQHASCVEFLKSAGDLAAKRNVTVLLETIDAVENPHVYLTTVTEAAEIVRKADHKNVKMLYDFYHEQIAAGNLIAKLEKNIDIVGLVHIADVPGRHEPGTGEINYTNIYRKLAELKYRGHMAMEFLPGSNPTESLRKAREMAAKAMAG